MEASLRSDFCLDLVRRPTKSARNLSAPSTPVPLSKFDHPEPSSYPRHIETDLERIFRQSAEQKSIDRIAELRAELKERSAAIAESLSPSAANEVQANRQPLSPWELLLRMTTFFCFALFVGVIGHFNRELPQIGRFLIDVVAAVLYTLWDLVNFPFQLWFDPAGTALRFSFNVTDAIIYGCATSNIANIVFFDLSYILIRDQSMRLENSYHIAARTKTILWSF